MNDEKWTGRVYEEADGAICTVIEERGDRVRILRRFLSEGRRTWIAKRRLDRQAKQVCTVPVGPSTHRLRDNPAEKSMLEAWVREVSEPRRRHDLLAYIMSPGSDREPRPVSERDGEVAAAVIQWLGSPVGQHWLANALGRKGLRELAAMLENER